MTTTGRKNQLYYGDNLDVLRDNISDESVDLIYLDPPFNSDRKYSVLFKEKSGEEAQAQIEAFDDTWTWSQDSESTFVDVMNGPAPNQVKDALEGMRRLLGDNDVLAYLVMMSARLIELRRVLKLTGSLYLHCDPTASHYLKILMDAIFGPQNFVNEIVWHYNTGGASNRTFSKKHDILLMYAKDDRRRIFNTIREPFREERTQHFTNVDSEGRKYRVRHIAGKDYVYYLDKGRICHDVWEIDALNAAAKERLGYPTQKPLALLDRLIRASSNEGDVVLDPFCGCGTAVDAAQGLRRRWIGIDITTLAVDLIDARMRHTYGEQVRQTYEVLGIPRDFEGARHLFQRSPFEFERWCVMMVDGQPNDRQVGDRGIDGVIRFPVDAKGNSDRALVSVKGGATNPAHIRDLVGTVQSQRAAVGVFICMNEPTKAMLEAANHSGIYVHPANGQRYSKVQIITVEQLLEGRRPKLPPTLLPYFQAEKRAGDKEAQQRIDL